MLEQRIDRQISYSSIAPSILHAFEIRDFKISSLDNSDDYLIEIEKLRLRFNLFKFKLSNPLNAFTGLLIVNSRLEYDETKNKELFEVIQTLTSDASGKQSESIFVLPSEFTIKGRNIGIKLDTEQFNANLSRVFFTLGSLTENDLSIVLKADAELSMNSLPEVIPITGLDIITGLKLNGRVDSGFSWADLNIQTKNFTSNLFSVEKLRWNFRYEAPGIISLTKTGDNIPFDITISVNTKNEVLKTDFQAQDFIFKNHFFTADFLDNYKVITEASISGTASLTYTVKYKIFNYDGDLNVKNLGGILEKPINISAAFQGENKLLEISDSAVTGDFGKAGFSGIIELSGGLPLINGMVKIPGITFSGYSLSSNLFVQSSSNGEYLFSADYASLNKLNLSAFSARILPYDENIEFALETDFRNPDETVDHLFSEGIIQLGEQFYIQALLSTKGLLITPLVNSFQSQFTMPEILSGIELTSEIYLSGTPEQLSFASPMINISDRNNDRHSLSFVLSGNNSGFRLTDLDLLWDENRLLGKISSDLTETNDLRLLTNLDFNGTAVNTAGVYGTDGSLSLSGDYGLKLNIFKPSEKINNFTFKSQKLPISNSKGQILYLSLNTAGYISSFEDWKILINNITLEEIPTGYGNGQISLAALLSPEGGSIYNISYSDMNSELKGSGSLFLSDFRNYPSGRAHLTVYSPSKNEEYNLILGFDKTRLEGSLNFTGFPFSRLSSDFPISGEINGNLAIAGSPASPELRLLLNTGDAVFNNERMRFDTAMYYENLRLQIEDFSGSYSTFTFEGIDGVIDFENGLHSLSGKFASSSKLLNLDADLTASIKTGKTTSIMKFPEVFTGEFKADVLVNNIMLNEANKNPWNFNIVRTNNILNLTGGVKGEINGSYFEDGHFSLSMAEPFPLWVSATGTIKEGIIDASLGNIQYIFDDLQFPMMAFYDGIINGNMKIQGPVNDPDYYGKLDFKDMEFKAPIVEDVSKPFNTSFFFSGKEITLPATRVETNNGIVFINLTASMERWLPRTYDININVPEGEPVSARFYRNPFYVYGFAEGEMHISGDLSHMNIDGNLYASEGIFMLNSNLDIRRMKNRIEIVTANLKIRVGENNQFIWPNQDLPIVKGFLSTGNTLTMLVDTDNYGAVLDGDLILKGGEIFYFEKNFYIKEGEIKFTNDIISTMDPLLSTRAEIRDINSDGEMTKIYLIVDESPLSSFIPRFESEPTMSTAEIIALIGGNFFETFEGDDFGLTNVLLLTTDLFTQFTIFKNIENSLKSSLGLDLLSIRSSFISNFLENTFFTPSDDLTENKFAKYLDNTTLFLGKYFTDDIFLQGMFQFDLYNDTGYSENLDFTLDSEIKLEWEGPIANVELSFFPDFIDPVAGLNKTSVGLSWRFSY